MNEGLIWLAAHRSDALLVIMVVAVALNAYAFIRQQRTLVELRRLLLIVRQGAIERRPRPEGPRLSNGGVSLAGQGRHRYNVTPRIIGGEGDEH